MAPGPQPDSICPGPFWRAQLLLPGLLLSVCSKTRHLDSAVPPSLEGHLCTAMSMCVWLALPPLCQRPPPPPGVLFLLIELSRLSLFPGDKALDGYSKKKYVCKLLFIFLLGHDIDFGHMEAVNLLSSNRYTEKQIVSVTLGVRSWGRMSSKRVLQVLTPHMTGSSGSSNAMEGSLFLGEGLLIRWSFLCNFYMVWEVPVGLD